MEILEILWKKKKRSNIEIKTGKRHCKRGSREGCSWKWWFKDCLVKSQTIGVLKDWSRKIRLREASLYR